MGWTFSGTIRSRIAGALAAALSLTACDTIGGLQRKAILDQAPDASCVKAAIEQTPGVAEVTDSHLESSGYSFAGKHVSVHDAFIFRGAPGSNIIGVVNMTNNDPAQGKDNFTIGLTDINHSPPQAQIDATRPVMLAIEQHVAASCGVPVLTAAVKETCSLGAKCAAQN